LNRIVKIARELGLDQSGASMVEYALMLALITIVCLGSMTLLGAKINDFFSSLSTTV